jgi:hypothetical protein
LIAVADQEPAAAPEAAGRLREILGQFDLAS